MRTRKGMKVAVLAATAGLALAACSSDSDTEASASASPTGATEAAMPDVSAIQDQVNTTSGCEDAEGTWSGGRVAGEGVVAGWQYGCDIDGDGTADTMVSIYRAVADLESDLPAIESAADNTGILQGADFIIATTDATQFDALSGLDVTVVREVAAG